MSDAVPVLSLDDILPELDCSHEAGYCAQPSAMKGYEPKSGKFYWDWEKEVAQPALEKLGYKVILCTDGERDSFGPLSRVFLATKDGVRVKIMYG